MESKATRGHLGRARMSRAQITEGESEAACRCRDAQGAGMGGDNSRKQVGRGEDAEGHRADHF